MNSLAPCLIFFLLASLSHANIEGDFCVADLRLPRGPEGYPCKDPAKVTAAEFAYREFGKDLTTENIFHVNATPAFVDQFPALNGLGISMAELYFGMKGVIPVHSHRTSEIIYVTNGKLIAGIIDSNNTAYYNTLEVGDVMIFPKYMLHFQINKGNTPARAIVALNGANPGAQITSTALFGGNLPPEFASDITGVRIEEVNRLNEMLGGRSGSGTASFTT